MSEIFTDNKILFSTVLIIVALTLRWLVIRHLRNLPVGDAKLPQQWKNSVKNTTNSLIVIGLIIIWLSELRFVALSIATFVVALVIATREFIQCFLGFIYQSSCRTFFIGDWIKVGNFTGEVVRTDWLSTTLLEIDMDSQTYDYTGKSLIVPNNQFVSNTVQNLNNMRRYIPHTFTITREAEYCNIFELKNTIIERIKELTESFHDKAQRYSSHVEERIGVNLPGPEPSVRIGTTNLGKNTFIVTVYCPTNEAVAIEQKIIETFMNQWYSIVEVAKSEKILKSTKNSESQGIEKKYGDSKGVCWMA